MKYKPGYVFNARYIKHFNNVSYFLFSFSAISGNVNAVTRTLFETNDTTNLQMPSFK